MEAYLNDLRDGIDLIHEHISNYTPTCVSMNTTGILFEEFHEIASTKIVIEDIEPGNGRVICSLSFVDLCVTFWFDVVLLEDEKRDVTLGPIVDVRFGRAGDPSVLTFLFEATERPEFLSDTTYSVQECLKKKYGDQLEGMTQTPFVQALRSLLHV